MNVSDEWNVDFQNKRWFCKFVAEGDQDRSRKAKKYSLDKHTGETDLNGWIMDRPRRMEIGS